MTTPPRRRARRGTGEVLRGEILAAARTLLAQKGHAQAVSIRAVAEAAGVTPPSIYLHFADKEALLSAVVADVFEQLGELMNEVGPAENPMERLCQQGMAYVRFALEEPEPYRLATMSPYRLATMSTHAEPGPVDHALHTTAFANFTETIVDCMAAGYFVAGDPTPIVLQLWAAAHGVASMLITKPDLPWGEKLEFAFHALGAAAVGQAIIGRFTELTPTSTAQWLTRLFNEGQTG